MATLTWAEPGAVAWGDPRPIAWAEPAAIAWRGDVWPDAAPSTPANALLADAGVYLLADAGVYLIWQ